MTIHSNDEQHFAREFQKINLLKPDVLHIIVQIQK